MDGASKLEILRGRVSDAAGKIALLEGEIIFAKALISVFGRIDRLRQVLDSIQQRLLEDRSVDAAQALVEATSELDDIQTTYDTCAARLLEARLGRLRAEVKENLLHSWDTLVHVDRPASKIKFQGMLLINHEKAS